MVYMAVQIYDVCHNRMLVDGVSFLKDLKCEVGCFPCSIDGIFVLVAIYDLVYFLELFLV
jgi:hypothetical protein